VTCTSKAQAALWAALAAHPPAGYQDLRGALEAAKAKDPGTLLYRKLDTHWNGVGALIYGRVLANSLDPTLWPTVTVTPLGDSKSQTDLEALLGQKDHRAGAAVLGAPALVSCRPSIRPASWPTPRPMHR